MLLSIIGFILMTIYVPQKDYQRHISEVRTESAKVVGFTHTPSHEKPRGSVLISAVTYTNTYYSIVFQLKDGSKILVDNLELYNKLQLNQEVTIVYQEIYASQYTNDIMQRTGLVGHNVLEVK